MFSIASTLLARRVRWIQSIARDPLHHQLLLATVTGQPNNSQYKSLDEHGVPTCHATPCLRQWWKDMQCVASKCRDFADHWRVDGWRAIF
eukprot:4581823-Heterocapsa_arctica.AAC.1